MNKTIQAQFEEIYHQTYKDVLQYIICHSSNILDVNAILQETYLKVFDLLETDAFDTSNTNLHIIQISKKCIQKCYSLSYKIRTRTLIPEKEIHINIIDTISINDINFIENLQTKEECEMVWKWIKQRKMIIIQMFYLYFYEQLSFVEIATTLKISEIEVKNKLYITLIKLRKAMTKEKFIYERESRIKGSY
ncbi:MAG: RNA polymerase sigma factor [Coprobacillaceae bacterium]